MVMRGKQLLPVLGELNAAFGGREPRLNADHRQAFGPGEALGPALANMMDGLPEELKELLAAYIGLMPMALQETLRSVIHYALTSTPQVLLNFAWVPAYEFELTVCEIVEPEPLQSGVTLLLKSPYPDEIEARRAS